MIRKLLVLIVVLQYSTMLNGQGMSNLFMSGYACCQPTYGGTNIDFYSGARVVDTTSRGMDLDVTLADITDSTGNLLFYTNGIYIADATNDTLMNGSGLNPSTFTNSHYYVGMSFSQGDLILPFPGHSGQYYLFHFTGDITNPLICPNKLYYTIIDMNGNGGIGTVTSKNNIALLDTLHIAGLTACKHANGRDWWISIEEFNRPGFYTLLLTPAGVSVVHHQQFGSRTTSSAQCYFSQDGTKYSSFESVTGWEILDFDRCTGLFSNLVFIPPPSGCYGFGTSISPDGSKAYACCNTKVYQVDLTSSNIPASLTTVATWDGTYSPYSPFAATFLLMQLAYDNKIYCTSGNSILTMHVIDKPDSAGLACDFQQHAFPLPTFNSRTLPNFPNYFLGPEAGSVCDSLSTGMQELPAGMPYDITVSPNPVGSSCMLHYAFPYHLNGWAELYDVSGRLLSRERLYWTSKQFLWQIDGVQAGTYIVKVVDDNGRQGAVRMVKQ